MEERSLHSLGYHFDDGGVLRDERGKRYVFVDQESYEIIGLAVTQEIYKMLQEPPYSMTKQYLDEKNEEKSAFIFVSKMWDEKERLVVLIHGSGAVRAGQWGRRLIINESLDMGSQLPYLRMCNERDWGVVVMNSNMNFYTDSDGCQQALPGSETATEHGLTVWRKYVTKAKASSIAVVAHSYGGTVIAEIMKECWSAEWESKLKCVCLTDGLFSLPAAKFSNMKARIRNWLATTDNEVGIQLKCDSDRLDCQCVNYVSAGTKMHDETSAYAMKDIFKFIDQCFETVVQRGEQVHFWLSEIEASGPVALFRQVKMMGPGELVSDWMQPEELYGYLELGDLVEFRRVIGVTKRRIYTHWGVFIGFEDNKAYIAHSGTDFGDFGGSISSSAESLATIKKKVVCANQIQIRRDELTKIAKGDSCRINNSLDRQKRPFPPVLVVDRALLMLGKTNYNILMNNCEHFANYCRYGLKKSSQATLAKTVLVTSATLCLTGSLTAGAVAFVLCYTFSRLGRGIKPYVPSYPDLLL